MKSLTSWIYVSIPQDSIRRTKFILATYLFIFRGMFYWCDCCKMGRSDAILRFSETSPGGMYLMYPGTPIP